MGVTVFVKFFGQLAEVAQTTEIVLHDVTDTNAVIEKIMEQYTLLNTFTYVVAVDKKIVSGNTALRDRQTIALMPPFSGG